MSFESVLAKGSVAQNRIAIPQGMNRVATGAGIVNLGHLADRAEAYIKASAAVLKVPAKPMTASAFAKALLDGAAESEGCDYDDGNHPFGFEVEFFVAVLHYCRSEFGDRRGWSMYCRYLRSAFQIKRKTGEVPPTANRGCAAALLISTICGTIGASLLASL
jgi:hypothetical protein